MPSAMIEFLSALLLALTLPAEQDPPTPPVPPSKTVQKTVLTASDGKPVAPGRIPEDADEEARRRWERFAAINAGRPAMTAFDLSFEVDVRGEGDLKQFDSAFTYLEWDHPRAPFLTARMAREDLVSIHGPDGTWLVDAGKVERMRGRDYQEDLRQIGEWRSIAGNLLSLAQPTRVRLVKLVARDVVQPSADSALPRTQVSFATGDPLVLPTAKLADLARTLTWIEALSPDLRVLERGRGAAKVPVYRALLGLDPKTGRVRMATMNEDRDGTIVLKTAILVLVPEYLELEGGWILPRDVEVRGVDDSRSPWTFDRRDGTRLWLLPAAKINPPLTPEDFTP